MLVIMIVLFLVDYFVYYFDLKLIVPGGIGVIWNYFFKGCRGLMSILNNVWKSVNLLY
jgi:hypothetical protein